MKKVFIALFMVATIINAQILQVEQLFNRKLTKVKKEPLGILKSFYGTTTFNEEKNFDVVSRFDGYITNLYANKSFKEIKKGETLFTIYSDEILTIQKELQLSKRFNKQLVNSSIEKLDSLNVDKQVIEKIKTTQKVFKDIPFYAKDDFVLLEKNINNGSYVKKGATLLKFASLEDLWFIAKVYQKDLNFIKEGMEANIIIDGFDKPFKSKVDFIYPNVDLETKSVDVRFVLENKNREIFPNMFARVELSTMQRERLILPKSSILNKGEKFYVFKPISQKEFEPVEVNIKRVSSNKYEIISGLKEGDEVIDNALFLLDSDAITNGLYNSDDEW